MVLSQGSHQSSQILGIYKTQEAILTEKTELSNAITKIETDRVMERISADQKKDILKNINEELTTVNEQLKQINRKIKTLADSQKWIDWVGEFKKTYAKVDDFTEEQKQNYLQGIVERIDVKLEGDTNNHLLSIKFRYPIVADRLVKSRKKAGDYTVYKGKHDKQVSAMSYQKIAGRPKKKAI